MPLGSITAIDYPEIDLFWNRNYPRFIHSQIKGVAKTWVFTVQFRDPAAVLGGGDAAGNNFLNLTTTD
jgi:hypothetical protein